MFYKNYPMIATSIQNKELQEILDLLPGLEMAEIRLDRCALEEEEIDQLFSESDVPLIATCRLAEESQAPALLERAIQAGAKYALPRVGHRAHPLVPQF